MNIARVLLTVFAFGLGFLFGTPEVLATPVMPPTTQTWDVADNLYSWTNAPALGNALSPLSNPGGYLQMTFPAVGDPFSPANDFMYSQDAAYVGGLTNSWGVRFSFRASDLGSATLRFRSESGHIWDLGFDTTTDWTTNTLYFVYSQYGWQSTTAGLTESDFYTDLASVDTIGIYVDRVLGDTSTQYYDLDNWEYFVPEPGTICMLGTFLLSFGLAQRRRLKDLLKQYIA